MKKKAVIIKPNSNHNFQAIDLIRIEELEKELQAWGIETFSVDLPYIVEKQQNIYKQIDNFSPDFILSLNLNYLLFGLSNPWLRNKKNLIGIWDDPFTALITAYTLYEDSDIRVKPVNLIFKDIMSLKNIIHFSSDSAQIKAGYETGILDTEKIVEFNYYTFEQFIKSGKEKHEYTSEISFSGNIPIFSTYNNPFWKNTFFRKLAIKICNKKLMKMEKVIWEIFTEEINNLSEKDKNNYFLFPENRNFWDFYFFIIHRAYNTLIRLEFLKNIPGKVNIYGMFSDPKAVTMLKKYNNIEYIGNFSYFDELPHIFSSSKINICISNGLIYSGIQSKFIECIASGGFCLTDPKDDLIRVFGEDIKKLFFYDKNDLNQKIEYYLTNSKERIEITNILREVIKKKCMPHNLISLIVENLD